MLPSKTLHSDPSCFGTIRISGLDFSEQQPLYQCRIFSTYLRISAFIDSGAKVAFAPRSSKYLFSAFHTQTKEFNQDPSLVRAQQPSRLRVSGPDTLEFYLQTILHLSVSFLRSSTGSVVLHSLLIRSQPRFDNSSHRRPLLSHDSTTEETANREFIYLLVSNPLNLVAITELTSIPSPRALCQHLKAKMATTEHLAGEAVQGDTSLLSQPDMREEEIAESTTPTTQANDGNMTLGTGLAGEQAITSTLSSEKSKEEVVQSSEGSEEIDQVGEGGPTFTCFPKLPLELQRKIWENSLPDPQFIEVRNEPWDMERAVESYDGRHWHIACKDKAPAIFFVCKETRALVLKHYIPIRSSEKGSPAAYYDPTFDVLVFRVTAPDFPDVFEFEDFLLQLSTEVVEKIEYMAWEAEETQEGNYEFAYDQTQTNHYITNADYHVTQAMLNKLRGLKCLFISQYYDNKRGLVVGFQEHAPTSEHITAKQDVIREITSSGWEWYQAFEAVRSDWVNPEIKFGEFITEE
jgi:2EXR family